MVANSIPTGWQLTTLENIAKKEYGLVDGPFGSNLPHLNYVPVGVPVIRGSNLSLGEVTFKGDEFVYISEETARRLERSLCEPEDIVFTKKGTLGQTGFVPISHRYKKFLISSNQMKLSVDRKIADPRFVYHYVSSPASREKIVRDAETTGVPKTNLAYLRTFPILLPPLNEQKAIAHILGTLDDKIELNQQMNQTLEAIAQALFKSWFVDFDPVHAKLAGRQPSGMDAETAALFPDEFEDAGAGAGAIGLIPKGWKVGRLKDIAQNSKRTIRPEQILISTPYIGLEHMPKRSIALSDWGVSDNVESNKFQFKQGEILFGKLRPYFHKVGVAIQDGVCSTDILIIIPNALAWFGLTLSYVSSAEFVEYTNRSSDGARMPRTSWQMMGQYSIVVPPIEVAEAFNKHILVIVQALRSNIFQSQTLTAIRDALLPKLLSGELRVKEAEKLVEVAA